MHSISTLHAIEAYEQTLKQQGYLLLGPLDVMQHTKGGIYKVLGSGKLQTSRPLLDMAEVVIYTARADGTLWVRDKVEFEDGRFKKYEGYDET